MSLRDDAEREVREFHQFIEEWLAGRHEDADDRYDRAEAVLPDDFEILSPDGERRDGAEIRADLRAGHGAFADSDPPFEIRVVNVRTRFESADECLLIYEEWQRRDGDWDGRISSALFRREDDAPNGVEWLHLHETWLPENPTRQRRSPKETANEVRNRERGAKPRTG
jgi:hypothetical protein